MPYQPPRQIDPDASSRGSERRRAGRVRCSQTSCQFGPISDFSRTGVKVLSAKPIKVPAGKTVNLRIACAGVTAIVPARVVANRRGADGRVQTGFEFVDLRPEWANALNELARIASSDAGRVHQLKFAS